MPMEQDPIHLPVPDSARRAVESLVDRYSRGAADYESAGYNEAQARIEFIDPFFEALGWDVANREGYAEPYKDVVHEDAIKVAGTMKAPDYCFRIGGQRKFFLEAKKPSVSLKTDIVPAYQLRRYAWSAKLPLSVLTDFQELAIYDCRERPKPADSASVARVEYLTYDQYPERLDYLYSTFSRDAILKGSFDRYALATKGKRGTSEVDDAFLAEIEAWREALAKDIARGNPDLSVHDLNFAVQRTVDRILFLRIAEDRGIEPHGRLQELAKRHSLYEQLCALYQEADGKYNAGLFDFTKEGDALTLRLTLSDRVIRDILKHLYYPDCPYEFSVIPADILGAVYERFLGKVIRLTAGHHAKVEEKPEVRKAGGVYYTPKYIVDYIVEHTVGELLREWEAPASGGRPGDHGSLEGPHRGDRPQDGGTLSGPPSARRPARGDTALPTLRILDPACGSGSFLLGAYQYLLDWHLKYYMDHDPKKHAKGRQPRVVQVGENDYRLTNAERKRILLDSIYGVDIDLQAVEVTKLNLLLKCMEGESAQQLRLLQERVLPNIDANIKCGNSLIGPDYWDGRQTAMFDEDESRRVNPFDWRREFPGIMANGGFDAVIGNPPYVQSSMADYADAQTNRYLRARYSSSMGRLNTFGLLIERALATCLAERGLLSFIVPNTLLTQEYYRPLRQLMLAHTVRSLTSFSEMVFRGAVVETVVFVVQRGGPGPSVVELVEYDCRTHAVAARSVSQSLFGTTHECAFVVTARDDLMLLGGKLRQRCPSLASVANTNQAIALKHDRAASLSDNPLGPNYKPVLDGRDIGRYALRWPGTYLAYDPQNIHSCKRTDIFEAPAKLLFRRVGDRLIATLDTDRYYALNTLVVISWKPLQQADIRYLLGLFNSRLLDVYYKGLLKSTKRVFSEIQARQVGQLPIRPIDFGDPDDVAKHDRMVSLVQMMLDLHKSLQEADTPSKREIIERQIDATDHQVDTLVYDLYCLTPAEIAVVEEATAR